MAVSENSVRVYEELAEHHGRHNELRQRDLFLVLAADAAQTLGQREHAERIRQRLLAVNPHHLLKPFGSLAQALQSPDIQEFVADLRRQCPPETAEQMLEARRNGLPPPSSAAPIPPQADEPELKVYRLQEAAEAAAVSPPPAPAPRGPAPRPAASPAVRPPSPPRTNAAPTVRPRPAQSPYAKGLPDGPVPHRKAPAGDEVTGGWVAVVLFCLVLLGALAVAAYTFLRPFLDR